ncbi:hypothetical protein IWZ03DRAFT_411152 [Phyllosticta citriasiana]|uniref:Nephrocystin 3-like N-terminal domain-containing protein n=1 Tax=Phyllosticta citriasiana TaxID=595635 RepID=A0ABR1KZV3_9PEZI
MYETKKREADHTPCDPVSLSVEECVAQIISILDQTPGIKVIDALDECDPSQRHTIRGALDDVVRQSSKPIMIFASSRDDQDIKEIIKTLINGSSGMFRWATLQIQNVCNQQRFKLESDVREEPGKLPTSLKESYPGIYEQILNSGPHSKRLA